LLSGSTKHENEWAARGDGGIPSVALMIFHVLSTVLKQKSSFDQVKLAAS